MTIVDWIFITASVWTLSVAIVAAACLQRNRPVTKNYNPTATGCDAKVIIR